VSAEAPQAHAAIRRYSASRSSIPSNVIQRPKDTECCHHERGDKDQRTLHSKIPSLNLIMNGMCNRSAAPRRAIRRLMLISEERCKRLKNRGELLISRCRTAVSTSSGDSIARAAPRSTAHQATVMWRSRSSKARERVFELQANPKQTAGTVPAAVPFQTQSRAQTFAPYKLKEPRPVDRMRGSMARRVMTLSPRPSLNVLLIRRFQEHFARSWSSAKSGVKLFTPAAP
jgi:hypothetical protein